MKVCKLALTLAALLATPQTFAADGCPSDSTLAAMGLADLNVISDDAGLAVRGHGFFGAKAYGQSFAAVAAKGGIASSTNGYFAKGNKYAGGDNFSFAGVEVKQSGGHYGSGHGGGKSFSIGAFAGGSSSGYRK